MDTDERCHDKQCPHYGRIYPTMVGYPTIWPFLVEFWSSIPRKSLLSSAASEASRKICPFFGDLGVFSPYFQVSYPISGSGQMWSSFSSKKVF